jgi:hypothetical protein
MTNSIGKQGKLALGIAAINAMVAGVAIAAPNLEVDVGAGLEYHSNAARTSVDEQSDVAQLARAAVTWRDLNSPLSADVGYAVEHRDYKDDVEDDETAVNGRANLNWRALPRRLDVILQHQISETQTDLRTVDTPSNRERRSVLTGGLNGYLNFSAVDSLVISPRYTEVTFSESEQSDSQRASVGASWVRALDAVSRLTVGGDVGKVEFDDSPQQDYDSQLVQIGYEAALSRLNYSVSGGVSRFNRDVLDDVDGHVVRAGINYRGDGFDVGGNFVSELTDSSIGLSGSEFSLSNFEANDANFNQVDVIERSQLDVFWNQQLDGSRSINLTIGAALDDYEALPQDQKRAYVEAGYRHELSTFLTLDARARFERTDFTDDPLGREYDDTTVTLAAQYRFTQDLDVRLSLTREDRSADDAVSEYTDNIAMLTVNYRLF